MRRIALATRTSVACVATVLVAFAFAAPAHAGFPGANGRVAFQSNQDGDYEVFTVDSAGAGLQQLTTNAATDGGPSWSAVLGSSNAVAEQKRGIWELNGGIGGRSILLYDGGSNGVFGIGDTVFATAGLFFP